jgi:hypothetical protein
MRPTDVPVGADRVQAQLNDGDAMLADGTEDDPERARRRLLCSCHHRRFAHRHYRPGSDCTLCTCQHWSPRNRVRSAA